MKESLPNNPYHIPVIDGIRGLAAVSVMLYHFVCTTTGFINEEWIRDIFSWGEHGVYMFFIISGIVIPLSLIRSGYTPALFFQFMLKRVIRLDPPYFIALIIAILIAYVRLKVPGTIPVDTTPSVKEVLLHIGYLIPFFDDVKWMNSVFWTLAVEFQYYIMLALTIPLFVNKKLGWRLCGYLLFLLLGYFGAPFSIHKYLFVYLPLFLIGITYCLNRCGIIKGIEQWLIAVPCLCLTSYTIGFSVAMVSVATLVLLYAITDHSNPVSRFFGNISYSLYLLHALVGASFVNFLSHWTEAPLVKVLVISGGVVIAVASAYFLYRFVEEPSKRFASRIKMK